MSMPLRVGVMGGTFDPIHLGHLRVAEETVEALELDTLLFVPAAIPPHKSGKIILPFEHRWQMLRLATEQHARFKVSDLERWLPGKSYTVVTLQKLSEERSGAVELFFIAGLDAFLEMDTWWHFKELFELAQMVVLRRPGHNTSEVNGFLRERVSSLYTYSAAAACYRHPRLLPVHCIENTWLDISSTRIRQLVKEGKSVRYLVIPEVMHYIHANQLYRGERLFGTEPNNRPEDVWDCRQSEEYGS
jgi:nicotinate-nucleotide adenylyltransferase